MLAQETQEIGRADAEAIAGIVTALVKAWNAGDGAAFGRWFAEDAEFVNVYGMYDRGRQPIIEIHRMIFSTVYAGSTMSYSLMSARRLSEDVALAHLHARLHVPQGPLAGDLEALPSMVLTRADGGWKIAAFHNTFIKPPQF